MSDIKKILVTGALGQIGTELTEALRMKYGRENVVAGDIKFNNDGKYSEKGPYYTIDVTKAETVEEIVKRHNIDTIFHMAAILSAVGESNPAHCWNVNMNGSINIIELGLAYGLNRIIIPSSIAVWGPGVPVDNTPQESVLQPTTMYGVTKVAGEVLFDYYVRRFGIDIRGLRYPGIISSEALPGGGTTDYAVAIYYGAVEQKKYACFVKEDTILPMMYMPDCIKATMDLAEAPLGNLKHHSNFNLGSLSFDVKELSDSIKKHIPDFEVTYEPDHRQKIAESWPKSVDDSAAREEWGWEPAWNLEDMTKDMLDRLGKRNAEGRLYQ